MTGRTEPSECAHQPLSGPLPAGFIPSHLIQMISKHNPNLGRLFCSTLDHPFDLAYWGISKQLTMGCYELQLKGTRQKDSYFTVSVIKCELGDALDAFDMFPDFPGCRLRLRDNFKNVLAERGMLFSSPTKYQASEEERLQFLLDNSPVQREIVKIHTMKRGTGIGKQSFKDELKGKARNWKEIELPKFPAEQLKQIAKATVNQLRSFAK